MQLSKFEELEIIETPIDGLIIIKPKVFWDNRGYFLEFHTVNGWKQNGLEYTFIQDNKSYSKFGVLRGLHFQKPPYAQSKLISVFKGEILDVVADIRSASPTFGKTYSIALSEESNTQLLVPKGMAHGFLVLSKEAVVYYKTDAPYSAEHESGIRYDDKDLNIDWKIPSQEIIISDKDLKLPNFRDIKTIF